MYVCVPAGCCPSVGGTVTNLNGMKPMTPDVIQKTYLRVDTDM
jgi:hypothetical protein